MRTVITREKNAGGEVVYQHEATTRFLKPRRYQGPWSVLMQISGEGLLELQARIDDRTIGMQAVRVLLAMLNIVELHDGNRVRAGRKDLARLLKMSDSNVGTALRHLVDCGFRESPQLRFSYYTISPRFAWYGTTPALKEALDARGMLDDKGMMKPRAA